MNSVATNRYLESLLAGQAAVAAQPGLAALRAHALERANVLTVPSTRDEDWRFTDLTPLYQLAFRPAVRGAIPSLEALAPWLIPDAAARLVFIDGMLAASLSTPSEVEGFEAMSIADGLETHRDAVLAHIGRIAPCDADAFRAINTAFLQDGAFVMARRNAASVRPVQVLHVSTQADVAVHPRLLVVAETGSDITVIEEFITLGEKVIAPGARASCSNSVAEFAVGENARVRHTRVQQESPAAFHIGACVARLARSAAYEAVSLAFCARLSRLGHTVEIAGEGARCRLDGLALIGGSQLADTHSLIDHAVPHGESRQVHKCVVGGNGHAVFNGRVMVRKDAQLTDSAQESRNLLLSPRARVDTKPQLEIFADDVKCAHGATVGQLDSEEVFYLRSRGFGEAEARRLLTYAFAAEVVDRIPAPSVVARLRGSVLDHTRDAA